jgi:hypothetical protein
MTTSTDIVNQALQMVGDNTPPVSGVAPNFDTSPAGVAASSLYYPCIQTVARQFGWDFARNTAPLSLSGNTAPFPWTFEYIYPANAVQIWQVMPATLTDINDPLPVNWVVANNVVNGSQTRVIQTNQANAQIVYNNMPNENTWDSLFREAVVRLLSSELAMAIFSKPDTSQNLLQSGGAFESSGEGRDS